LKIVANLQIGGFGCEAASCGGQSVAARIWGGLDREIALASTTLPVPVKLLVSG
jgi:hypothetical protein